MNPLKANTLAWFEPSLHERSCPFVTICLLSFYVNKYLSFLVIKSFGMPRHDAAFPWLSDTCRVNQKLPQAPNSVRASVATSRRRVCVCR
jgi:hypothetical protein